MKGLNDLPHLIAIRLRKLSVTRRPASRKRLSAFLLTEQDASNFVEPMTTIGRLILCGAVLGMTGCAAEQELQRQGTPRDRSEAVTSPAREQVLRGLAELAVTDRIWSSFDEASANRITAVKDGSPIFVNIRTSRPLGDLALPADPNGRYTFSPFPHLYLHVGDDTSLRSLSTCYITLGPEDLGSRELVVPLAPLAYRPGGNPTDCWLAAAASSRRGAGTYEIRLAGLAAPMQNWLPIADLLAVEQVVADYSAGTPKYAAMLASPPEQAPPAAAPTLAGPGSGSNGASSVGPAVGRDPRPPVTRNSVPALSGLIAVSPLGPSAGSPTGAKAPVAVRDVPIPSRDTPAPAGEIATPPRLVPTPVREVPIPTREVPTPVREVSTSVRDVSPPARDVSPPVRDVSPPREAAAPSILQATSRESPATAQVPARIVIHHYDGDAAALARALNMKEVLASRPGFTVEVRPVAARVSADNIRVFYETDRETAYAARNVVAGGTVPIRDFTDYRPLPRPGTIELWLAPRGDGGNSPRQ